MQLPRFCYSLFEGRVVLIAYGSREPIPIPTLNAVQAELLNNKNGVTEEQRLAMEAGVVFGWSNPAALIAGEERLFDVALPVVLTKRVQARNAEHAVEVASIDLPQGAIIDGFATAEVSKFIEQEPEHD